MRVQKSQNNCLSFGLNIDSSQIEKPLSRKVVKVRAAITNEINALRKEYSLSQGSCQLEQRSSGRGRYYVIKGEEGTVYSGATEKFKLLPGNLTEAFKSWHANFMKLREVHDPHTRKMIDAFGPDLVRQGMNI